MRGFSGKAWKIGTFQSFFVVALYHNKAYNNTTSNYKGEIIMKKIVAMILAALAAEGETTIGGVRYIDRGYEDVVKKLTAVGADIARVDFPENTGLRAKRA